MSFEDMADETAEKAAEAAEASGGGPSIPNIPGSSGAMEWLKKDTANIDLERLHGATGLPGHLCRVLRVGASCLPGGKEGLEAATGDGDGTTTRAGDLLAAGVDFIRFKFAMRQAQAQNQQVPDNEGR